MTRGRTTSGRRGFTLTLAIFTLGVAAALVATVAAGLAADVRRTRRLGDEAQVRQLLLAGIEVAAARAGEVGSQDVPVPVGSLRVTVAGEGDTRSAEVEAGSGASRGAEVVTLKRSGEGWAVESVRGP